MLTTATSFREPAVTVLLFDNVSRNIFQDNSHIKYTAMTKCSDNFVCYDKHDLYDMEAATSTLTDKNIMYIFLVKISRRCQH